MAFQNHEWQYNADANDSIFVYDSATHFMQRAMEKRYPELKARMLFPKSGEDYRDADIITYEVFDSYGVAALISSYADSIPRADVTVYQFQTPTRPIAVSYGFDLHEIAKARRAGKPIGLRKQDAAIKAYEESFDAVAWYGDTSTKVPGFLTNPNIPIMSAIDQGGGVYFWTAKTPDAVLLDLHTLFNSINADTNEVEFADTLLLPGAYYDLLANMRIPNTTETVLAYFLRTNRYCTAIETVPLLARANPANNGPMAIAYRRSTDVVELIESNPMEMLPPQTQGLEQIVVFHGRTGGVIVLAPLSCRFLVGFGPVLV